MLGRLWKRIVGVLLLPSGIGGAFLGLALLPTDAGHHRLGSLLVGWLYGISVWGLMRLLSVPRGWSWLAGIFAGPIPVAVLMPGDVAAEERAGAILFGCVIGCLLGLLEGVSTRRGGSVEHARAPFADPAGLPSERREP